MDWVTRTAAHTKPAAIHWCDGSEEELAALQRKMQDDGTLIPVAEPGSFLHRSDPSDVARTEHLTFICSKDRSDAGPTNNWMSPEEALQRIWPLLAGSMAGRTMYVVPYVMGPIGSPYARCGVQLTDSAYVVANLRTMTRMGRPALEALGTSGDFVMGVHSLGDLSPERRFVAHFPEDSTIWSVGSGYGGNALLSKKCHALRIASVQGRKEGWLAEHMAIIGVTDPRGVKHYVAAAFPSACGKTNLAMLVPSLPGWSVETVGDDICWMHVGEDGRLWAVNPEAGMFGVAPGTSMRTNPNAIRSLARDVIYTNVALRADGTPWWEGKEPLGADESLTDWRGQPWRAGGGGPAAHPNSRFTVSLRACPSAGSFDDPRGVPISAILFGGRRARVAPLVYEARGWRHGVYVGATMASETTAAATGATGIVRNDPMAMLPFCGYNMADYFDHWLTVGRRLTSPPKIFHVNWFRQSEAGKMLWPGYGDNVRVLDWILRRVENRARGRESPIGILPAPGELDVSGLDLSEATQRALLAIDHSEWLEETLRCGAFLDRFESRLPHGLVEEHGRLVRALTNTMN